MRVMLLTALVSIAASTTALAQESYPDLVGTWKGQSFGVQLKDDGSGDFYSEDVTQVVTEQKDRRFVGRMFSGEGAEQFRVSFAGIFLDATSFRWSEPNGFVEGRMIDPETMDSCYVQTGAPKPIVTCHILKRQKQGDSR